MKKLNLVATFLRSYKKSGENGQPARTVFVYEVKGNKSSLDAYKEAFEKDGYDMATSDAGHPLYFTSRPPVGNSQRFNLDITTNNNIVADTSKFDMLEAQINSTSQPELRSALATGVANALVSQLFGDSGASSSSESAPSEGAPVEKQEDPASEENTQM